MAKNGHELKPMTHFLFNTATMPYLNVNLLSWQRFEPLKHLVTGRGDACSIVEGCLLGASSGFK